MSGSVERGSASFPAPAVPHRLAGLMADELIALTRRIPPAREGIEALLRERAMRTLLTTAEADARGDDVRRHRLYRAAHAGSTDCERLLRIGRSLRQLPGDALLSADAVIRMAQQALIISAGVMAEKTRG